MINCTSHIEANCMQVQISPVLLLLLYESKRKKCL